MNNHAFVSIVITSYNHGRFLRDAIDSTLSQTYSYTEIIVVDDGSTDNSQEIIASYGDRIVPVVKENGGEASAFNAGFAASRGNILCFLDSDDLFLSEKVAKIVAVFTQHPAIGSCFHTLKALDETGAGLALPYMALTGERDFRSGIRKGKMPFIATAMSGMCFRRPLLQLICPMPEIKGRAIGEHYIKWVSLALQPTFFLDEALALQRIHSDNSYTGKADDVARARNCIVQACWLREQGPEILTPWADRIFADGLGTYWRSGGIEEEFYDLVRCYLGSLSRFARMRVALRALCYRLDVEKLRPSIFSSYSATNYDGATYKCVF